LLQRISPITTAPFYFFQSIFGAIICQFKRFRLNQTLEHNYIFITRVKFILLKNETPFG
jgi:hypothetical protein